MHYLLSIYISPYHNYKDHRRQWLLSSVILTVIKVPTNSWDNLVSYDNKYLCRAYISNWLSESAVDISWQSEARIEMLMEIALFKLRVQIWLCQLLNVYNNIIKKRKANVTIVYRSFPSVFFLVHSKMHISISYLYGLLFLSLFFQNKTQQCTHWSICLRPY